MARKKKIQDASAAAAPVDNNKTTTVNSKKTNVRADDPSAVKPEEIADFEQRHNVTVGYSPLNNTITIAPAVYGAATDLPLISRGEIYVIGRAFCPSIVNEVADPGAWTDDATGSLDTDPWNVFIYPKAGRSAITFNELSQNNFYLNLKTGTTNVYGQPIYRKYYFNGEAGQFPRLDVQMYYDPESGNYVAYEKYQYVTTLDSSSNFQWPGRKVTLHFSGLNFLVDVTTDPEGAVINDNRSRNNQIVEITLPETFNNGLPVINLSVSGKVLVTSTDIRNIYRYAIDSGASETDWGGAIKYYIEGDDSGEHILHLYATNRGSGTHSVLNESIDVVKSADTDSSISLTAIDHDVDIFFSPVRKNYTKRFVVLTDGNVIISNTLQINDYIHIYEEQEILDMNEPDPIVVGYQNTIGFFRTASEWPWNAQIRIRAAIAELYQGIRFAALWRYNSENSRYDEYMSYRQGETAMTWDSSTMTNEGITCTASHEYSEAEPFINYDITLAHNALDEDWERQIVYLAFEPIPKFVSTRIKIFLGADPGNGQSSNPGKFNVAAGSGTQFYEGSEQFVAHIGSLWSFNYDTQEGDMGTDESGAQGLIFNVTNVALDPDQYSHIYVSDNSASSVNTTRLTGVGESTTVAFSGRIYNNMSIYVRPLIAAKLYFNSNHFEQFSGNNFSIEYSQSLTLDGDHYVTQLSSERDFTFTVRHNADNTYTHISARIIYGPHAWYNLAPINGDYHIPINQPRTFTIEEFSSLMSPTIDTCTVTLTLSQIYELTLSIAHPTDIMLWPIDAATLYQNQLQLSNGQMATATSVTDTGGMKIYTFADVLANSGTGTINIDTTHRCAKATTPGGGVYSLTNDTYQRTAATISGSGCSTSLDNPYVLTISDFTPTTWQLQYQCDQGNKLKILVYQYSPSANNGWPMSMTGVTHTSTDWTLLQTWTPSADGATATVNSNTIHPYLCFRVMQFGEDEDNPQTSVDFYSKLTVTIRALQSGSQVASHSWTDYILDTSTHRWLDIYPGSISTTAMLDCMKASHNGDYTFSVDFHVEAAYSLNMFVYKVSYTEQTMQHNWTDSTFGSNVPEIPVRIPGNHYSETTPRDVNLKVFVDTAGQSIGGTTGKHMTIHFIDSTGTGELQDMYPTIANPTQVSTGKYCFDVTTEYGLWAGDHTPSGNNYSSDSTYKLKIHYTDDAYPATHYDKTIDFKIQPVFSIWFGQAEYSFNNSGDAMIYFFCHIAAEDTTVNTRTPNPTGTPPTGNPSDPVMGWPAIGQPLPATGTPITMTNGTGLTMTYEGTEFVTGTGTAYKIKVSGGVGFTGIANIKATVLNQEETCTLRNAFSVAGIHWWRGDEYNGTMNMDNALLSPLSHTSSQYPEDIRFYVKFADTTGLAFNDDETKLTLIDSTYANEFTMSKSVPTPGTYIDTDDGTTTHHELYDIMFSIKTTENLFTVDWNLCNVGGTMDYTRARYGGGMPIVFKMTVKKTGGNFTYTFPVTLGPILSFETHNDTGGNLKPTAGEKYNIRMRSREFFWNGTGVHYTDGWKDTINGRTVTTTITYDGHDFVDAPTGSHDTNTNANPTYTYDITRRYTHNGSSNVNISANAKTTWGEDPNNPGYPYGYTAGGDWGAWEIRIDDPNGLPQSGTLKAKYELTGGTPAMHSWYAGEKSITFPVTEGFSVVGARYLKSIDKTDPTDWQLVYEDCSSNWQNGLKLMSIDANGQGAKSFEIFISAPAGGTFYFDLVTNVQTTDRDFEDLFTINVSVPTGGGTYNGQHYDVVAYCESYDDDFFVLRHDYGLVGLYSDQVLQFKISGTPSGGSAITQTVDVTVCKFGQITNALPSQINGVSGTTETFNAYIDLVEKVGSTIQLVSHHANETSIIKKSWEASGFTMDDYITRTYNSSAKQYTLTVDNTIPSETCRIDFHMCINEPCYDLGDFTRRADVKLTLYMNFYTTEDPLGASFILTPTGTSTGFFFYSSTPPSITNYTHTLNDMYKGSVKYYYATFKVQSLSNGHNQIYRVTQNGSPVLTGMWIAFNSPESAQTLQAISESGNIPFPYFYENLITMRKNDPQIVSSYQYPNVYTVSPMTNAGSAGPYKPSVNWGFNQPISTSGLSEKPFWDGSFIPS